MLLFAINSTFYFTMIQLLCKLTLFSIIFNKKVFFVKTKHCGSLKVLQLHMRKGFRYRIYRQVKYILKFS